MASRSEELGSADSGRFSHITRGPLSRFLPSRFPQFPAVVAALESSGFAILPSPRITGQVHDYHCNLIANSDFRSKQSHKTSLLKMMIASECICDIEIAHDDE